MDFEVTHGLCRLCQRDVYAATYDKQQKSLRDFRSERERRKYQRDLDQTCKDLAKKTESAVVVLDTDSEDDRPADLLYCARHLRQGLKALRAG